MQTNIPIAKQPFIVASKRKKNSPPEETVLQHEISSLPQKLSDISEMIQSSANFDDGKIMDLTHAIDNLTKVLSEKLDTIIDLLKTSKSLPSANYKNVTNHQPIGTLEKLRDLKNARNSSVYKLSYNKTHCEVYSSGLIQNPTLVPKKLHEPIGIRDSYEIQELKNKRTVRKIEDEIELLRYHSKIHDSKIASIDKKAEEVINNILNAEERNRTTQKWRQLISLSQETIEKKWIEKKIFLQSDKHMIALGTKRRMSHHHNEPGLITNLQDHRTIARAPINLWQRNTTTHSVNAQDVDMESDWTVVQNQKNSRRFQGSTRLNQQLSKSSTFPTYH